MQAWLNQTPKGCHNTNRQQYGDCLPECPPGYEYMQVLLDDMGTVAYYGTGAGPLSFPEIESWSRLMGVQLTGFQVLTVRRMSEGYAAILSNPDAPCPVDDERVNEQINAANIAMWKAIAQHE